MVREASNFFHVRKKWCGKVREGAGSIQFFSCKKKNTINHYHIFLFFFLVISSFVILLTTPV
jgi:hypothetical protein